MKRFLLAICLMVSLNFYILAQDSIGVKSVVLAKTSSSWDGSNLQNYGTGKPLVTILKITIPPKTKLPVHKHPVINAGVLLKGELTVKSEDGKVLHLKAGDSIIELVNKWHYGINEGSVPAEIIVFYAGTVGTPITVKKKLE